MTPLNMIQIAACTLNRMLLDVNVSQKRGLEFNGVLMPFQQYFSYIMAVSFIGGGNRSTPQREKKIIVMDSGSQLTYPIKIQIC
jgi:hypothetical protein